MRTPQQSMAVAGVVLLAAFALSCTSKQASVEEASTIVACAAVPATLAETEPSERVRVITAACLPLVKDIACREAFINGPTGSELPVCVARYCAKLPEPKPKLCEPEKAEQVQRRPRHDLPTDSKTKSAALLNAFALAMFTHDHGDLSPAPTGGLSALLARDSLRVDVSLPSHGSVPPGSTESEPTVTLTTRSLTVTSGPLAAPLSRTYHHREELQEPAELHTKKHPVALQVRVAGPVTAGPVAGEIWITRDQIVLVIPGGEGADPKQRTFPLSDGYIPRADMAVRDGQDVFAPLFDALAPRGRRRRSIRIVADHKCAAETVMRVMQTSSLAGYEDTGKTLAPQPGMGNPSGIDVTALRDALVAHAKTGGRRDRVTIMLGPDVLWLDVRRVHAVVDLLGDFDEIALVFATD